MKQNTDNKSLNEYPENVSKISVPDNPEPVVVSSQNNNLQSQINNKYSNQYNNNCFNTRRTATIKPTSSFSYPNKIANNYQQRQSLNTFNQKNCSQSNSNTNLNDKQNENKQILVEYAYNDCPFHNVRTEWYI